MSAVALHVPSIRFAGPVLNWLDVSITIEAEGEEVWAEISVVAFNGAPEQHHRFADVPSAIKSAYDIAADEGRNICVHLGYDLIWRSEWGPSPSL